MDAQERSAIDQIAHDHRHRCLDMPAAVQNLSLESEDLKHSPLGWHPSGGNLPDSDRWCHDGPAFGLRWADQWTSIAGMSAVPGSTYPTAATARSFTFGTAPLACKASISLSLNPSC